MLVPAEESLFGFYARFGYRTVFTCRTETVPAARGDCSITPLTPDGWQSLRELQLYDSHLSYPPELLRWQETISRSSGAGLYRIETGDAVCCAAAERDGETLLVRELLPGLPGGRRRAGGPSSDAGRRPSARLAARSPSAWQNRSTERRSRSGPTSARRLSKAEHVPAPKFDGSGGQ